jgi:hypothetical protein
MNLFKVSMGGLKGPFCSALDKMGLFGSSKKIGGEGGHVGPKKYFPFFLSIGSKSSLETNYHRNHMDKYYNPELY